MAIIIICGQTATGKSDLAVTLARLHHGEIISADSRQIYKGLDIGSNKITSSEMLGVTHWGLDLVQPGERFTVAQFQSYARTKIADILSRNKTPIIVGGTGLYIDATIFSGFSFGDTNEKKGSLEYTNAEYFFDSPHVWFGLHAPREYLVERIRARAVRNMHAITAETRTLIDGGIPRDWLHRLGLEYRYGVELLEGSITESEYIETITTKTWQYARRQMTWFKRNTRIEWRDVSVASNE